MRLSETSGGSHPPPAPIGADLRDLRRVRSTPWPLPELIHSFLDAGLAPERLEEGGKPVPTVLAIQARKH
jgi:hypothetical protein